VSIVFRHIKSRPPTFEELKHGSALVLYETDLPEGGPFVFEVDEVRDQAWVSVDGVPVGTMLRTLHERAIAVPAGARLSVLVEEQGRVNYAERIGEPKGLIGTPRLDGIRLEGWTATPIDVARLAETVAGRPSWSTFAGAVALRGSFTCEASTDLFLDTDAWGKGYAFINGFFLGRYWRNGPQRTLYVPAPVVRAGQNELMIFESLGAVSASARFVARPELGQTEA
jgi:beta-galactosidase